MRRLLFPLFAAAVASSTGCFDNGGNGSAQMSEDLGPSVSAINDSSAMANSSNVEFDFTVDDDMTVPGDLMVMAASDNQSLLMDDQLAVTGDSGQRTLSVTPTPGQTGSATVTITVTDGAGQDAQTSFLLTVVPQRVSFNTFFRDTFSAGENEAPRAVNDKVFDDDATDFDDLAAM